MPWFHSRYFNVQGNLAQCQDLETEAWFLKNISGKGHMIQPLTTTPENPDRYIPDKSLRMEPHIWLLWNFFLKGQPKPQATQADLEDLEKIFTEYKLQKWGITQ